MGRQAAYIPCCKRSSSSLAEWRVSFLFSIYSFLIGHEEATVSQQGDKVHSFTHPVRGSPVGKEGREREGILHSRVLIRMESESI